MKHIHQNILLLILLLCPALAFAQVQRSTEFKEKYTLKEVVVLSRHNIRSPLSSNGSMLSRITPHEWTSWSAAPSELTLRGGALETMMGQYFRKWLVDENLFEENHVPTTDEVNFYANSMQRTIATAQYFSSGFMPLANLHINHRFTPSKMDPVFFPGLTRMDKKFEKEALEEIENMGGRKGLKGISKDLGENYQKLADVLDFKKSEAYKSGEIKDFEEDDIQIILRKGAEPAMKGGLKNANSAADALILQYYEEPDALGAAFGHKISTKDWEKIAEIKDVYGDVLFTAPSIACHVAHPLLVYIHDELCAADRKFTFLCGHDSNIASVTAALEVEAYELPEAIEKKTPIGSKLVFEKWTDRQGKEYIAINLVYQSVDQLRNLELLDLKNPPMVYSLQLKGLKANSEGLYLFDDILARFEEAIRNY